MRRKDFIKIFVGVAIVGLVIWWLGRGMSVPTKGTTGVITITQPIGNVASQQIALPKIRPAIVPDAMKRSSAAPASETAVDPQTDLKTAIVDIANCYRIGTLADFYRTYTQPQRIDPERLRAYQQTQEIIARDGMHDNPMADAQVRAWEELESQTPVFNATGDEATFQFTLVYPPVNDGAPDVEPAPPAETRPMKFIKIDGK